VAIALTLEWYGKISGLSYFLPLELASAISFRVPTFINGFFKVISIFGVLGDFIMVMDYFYKLLSPTSFYSIV